MRLFRRQCGTDEQMDKGSWRVDLRYGDVLGEKGWKRNKYDERRLIDRIRLFMNCSDCPKSAHCMRYIFCCWTMFLHYSYLRGSMTRVFERNAIKPRPQICRDIWVVISAKISSSLMPELFDIWTITEAARKWSPRQYLNWFCRNPSD